jgi:hypothetical protein
LKLLLIGSYITEHTIFSNAYCKIKHFKHGYATSEILQTARVLLLLQQLQQRWTRLHAHSRASPSTRPLVAKGPGYLDAVAAGWNYPVHNANAFCMLDVKFRNMARVLKSWSQKFIGNIRFQLGVAKEVIFQLERAQESRALSAEEQVLRHEFNFKCLGLDSLNGTIIHQRSRLTFLKEGDTDTKFFHLQACHHGRKSFINWLHHQGETVVHELDKAQIVFDYFDAILGSSVEKSCALDFGMLNMPSVDLSGLDVCFSEDEIWKVIRKLPPDKVPGSDGFMRLFLHTAWPIIEQDIMQALHAFRLLDSRSFFLVNQAYTILLRKKPEAECVQDFHPISLIHNLSKLITKTFSLRLLPHMGSLVMPNQSAFIKG